MTTPPMPPMPPMSPVPPPAPRGREPIHAAGAILGTVLFPVINLVVFLLALATGSVVGLGIAAALLAAVAFGGGSLLLWQRPGLVRGLGLGLMIGWALMSIITAGFCTGLNPSLYSSI